MPSYRDLQKRLSGVKTSYQLANAMKTVSSAKYARVSSAYNSFSPYAEECGKLFASIGGITEKPIACENRKCFVLLTGNKGLCGSYNTLLFNYFCDLLKNENSTFNVICGKWGINKCREKSIPCHKEFVFSDVPEFSDAVSVCEYLKELYLTGKVSEIVFVKQKFINIMRQEPECVEFLPFENEFRADNNNISFIPDKETLQKALSEQMMKTRTYFILLDWASGWHGSTMMAMRTASDNAKELIGELKLKINRLRQAKVTNEVIETSSSNS